jgi:hypothetical protein
MGIIMEKTGLGEELWLRCHETAFSRTEDGLVRPHPLQLTVAESDDICHHLKHKFCNKCC